MNLRNPYTLLLSLILACAASVTPTMAQDWLYVSDKQYIPLRSGPGTQFRIVHRGIPSGTKLTVTQESEDGVYSEITTERGTTGWIRSQYLMSDQPAQLQLDDARARAAELSNSNDELMAQMTSSGDELRQQLFATQTERDELETQLSDTAGELLTVSDELSSLKQISSNAVQLDTDNRRLAEQTELLKSEVETLQAENQRLSDKLESEAFMDGALAVLLGVGITLAIPYLWPKRKRHSEWA